MKTPINVFSDWAKDGRDEKMAQGHNFSVNAMLDFALEGKTNPFDFIDAGCGNGWVVREISKQPLCKNALGVDGSQTMIDKARLLDSKNQYICSDLMDWKPSIKVDLVLSMEVFYYVEKPEALISHVVDHWMKPKGRLIMGIDYYLENIISESWSEDCGISIMTRLSESEWISGFKAAGLKQLKSWREGGRENWAGTLVVTGIK